MGWAYQVRELLGVYYLTVKEICLVMDDLNMHALGFLCEVFLLEVVLGLAEWLELYFIPKYGSWFNVVEVELSVMAVQCLDRCVYGMDVLAE